MLQTRRRSGSALFLLLIAGELVSQALGQGLYAKPNNAMGATRTADLFKQYAGSKAWRAAYKLQPRTACSTSSIASGAGTGRRPDLCGAAGSGNATAAEMLLLATSPQVYSSLNVSDTGGLNLAGSVGDQGPCNTCTAFAVSSAAEMAVASVQHVDIREISISPQGLFFCSGANQVCTASWTLPEAIKQLQDQSRHIPTSACLPYQPDSTGFRPRCQVKCPMKQPFASWGNFAAPQYTTIQQVQQHIRLYGGVVSRFDVDVELKPFFENSSNARKVYRPRNGVPVLFTHAVVLVGYNNDERYWLVKNSWGKNWGDNGYFRVAFDTCAVLTPAEGEATGLVWMSSSPWKLRVTPANISGCYWYKAQAGDYPSKIAATAQIPLESFMLNNTAIIRDLDKPLAGTKVLLCGAAPGTVLDPAVDPQLDSLLTLKEFIDTKSIIQNWQVPPTARNKNDSSDVYCGWRDIQCSNDATSGRRLVQEININKSVSDEGLTGILPPAEVFENLPGLKRLTIREQQGITGTVPADWSKMGGLEQVDLDSNGLTGTLPPWSGMKHLRTLSMPNNRLAGTLPESWGGLANLESINVLNNTLTGVLPPNYANLSHLRLFDVWRNKISGTLPDSYKGLSALQVCDFSMNHHIDGALPASWAQLNQLRSLALFQNLITGTLPAAWASGLKALDELKLQDNRLTGTLPESWGGLKTLTLFHLSRNKLNGTLPATYGQLQNLKDLSLLRNDFSGTIPRSWGAFTSLENVYLAGNKGLTGCLPCAWQQVLRLAVIDGTNLTGYC